MYYCHTRYYVPKWLRWLNSDNVEYLDTDDFAGINLFVYCGNNPVIASDPDGTFNWQKFGKCLAILAVAVAIVVVVAATAGSAAPIVAGAILGAAVSGTTSAGMQLLTTGTIDVGQLVVDTAVGTVLGAFGGSTVCRIGMMFAGAGAEFSGSIASNWINDESIDWKSAGISAGFGGAFGFIGGPGSQYGKAGARKQTLKRLAESKAKYKSGIFNEEQFAQSQKALNSILSKRTAKLNKAAFQGIYEGIYPSIIEGILDFVF